jgi:hypothetical protein
MNTLVRIIRQTEVREIGGGGGLGKEIKKIRMDGENGQLSEVNIKSNLCFIKHCAMKTYGEVKV